MLKPEELKRWKHFQLMERRPYLFNTNAYSVVRDIGLSITAYSAYIGNIKSWTGVLGVLSLVVSLVAMAGMRIFKPLPPNKTKLFRPISLIIGHLKG